MLDGAKVREARLWHNLGRGSFAEATKPGEKSVIKVAKPRRGAVVNQQNLLFIIVH